MAVADAVPEVLGVFCLGFFPQPVLWAVQSLQTPLSAVDQDPWP